MSNSEVHTSEDQVNESRRSFIGKTAALTTVAIAPGLFLHASAGARDPSQAVTDKVRWGMLIDTNKCADGCTECVSACNSENGLPDHGRPASDPQWIRKVKLRDNLTGRETNLPMLCQHCEHPPCVDVCPTGASFKRADGIVMVDRHVCIGCRYCMMACPYKARSFIHETITEKPTHAPRGKGCVESCTLCVHRLDRGETTTACAEACPHQAILFGDLNDPNGELAQRLKSEPSRQIRADLQLNTGVRYTSI